MSHLCATGRKAIATASQKFLNHATLLLEALWPIQTQIQLQYADNHIKQTIWQLKGCLGLFNHINLDNITGLNVVVVLQPDTTLIIIADFLNIIFEATQ